MGRNVPGATVDIKETPGGRVVGSVVYDGFATMEQIDRQMTVRRFLSDAKEIGANLQNIGVLLMYTPDELRIMRSA